MQLTKLHQSSSSGKSKRFIHSCILLTLFPRKKCLYQIKCPKASIHSSNTELPTISHFISCWKTQKSFIMMNGLINKQSYRRVVANNINCIQFADGWLCTTMSFIYSYTFVCAVLCAYMYDSFSQILYTNKYWKNKFWIKHER